MTISYNPFDPAQVDDDEEVLTQLRHETRVAELMPGVFYVTRYDDVAEISRDAKRFPQAPFRPLEEDTRTPDELQLGESNPPGHTKMRKILASVLSPPRIRALEPLVDRVCADLVDAFAAKGSRRSHRRARPPAPRAGDRRAHRRARRRPALPARVLRPRRARGAGAGPRVATGGDRPRRRVRRALPRSDPRAPQRHRQARRRHDRAHRVPRRRRQPDSPTRRCCCTSPRTSSPAASTRRPTSSATSSTTSCTTPGTYERLRDDRSLVPTAVEECLRHRPVVNVLFRRPAEDQVVGGVTIPAGSTVALGYSSANHDETVFECPEQLRPRPRRRR